MRLTGFQIEGTRGVSTGEVQLGQSADTTPQWIVLAGPNGVGKTTILQGIAAGVLGTRNLRRLISPSDDSWIGADKNTATSKVWLAHGPNDALESAIPRGARSFWAEVSLNRDLEEADAFPSMHGAGPGFGFGTLQRVRRENGPPIGWTFAAYGANRFDAPSTSIAEELANGPARPAAVATLFRRDASLFVTNQWVQGVLAAYLQLAMKRIDQDGVHADNWRNPDAETSRIQNQHWGLSFALNRVFEEIFGRDGHNRVELRPDGLVLRTGGAGTLPTRIRHAGQGFESLALLVADLLRQQSVTYGDSFLGGTSFRPDHLKDDYSSFQVPHSGVVLIDEAENHLHPELEKRLRETLCGVFPNVQFILTTHSPFIAQTAEADGLYRVTAGGAVTRLSADEAQVVRTGTVDDVILTSMFGLSTTYSRASEALRDELVSLQAEVLRGRASPDQRARLVDLRRQLDVGPSMDRSASKLAELREE